MGLFANIGLFAVYFCIAFVLLYFKNCLSVHCIVSFLAFRLQLLNKLEFKFEGVQQSTVSMRDTKLRYFIGKEFAKL